MRICDEREKEPEKIVLSDLKAGDVFQWKNSSVRDLAMCVSDRHTMKIGIVYLNTGNYYSDFRHTLEVIRVDGCFTITEKEK